MPNGVKRIGEVRWITSKRLNSIPFILIKSAIPFFIIDEYVIWAHRSNCNTLILYQSSTQCNKLYFCSNIFLKHSLLKCNYIIIGYYLVVAFNIIIFEKNAVWKPYWVFDNLQCLYVSLLLKYVYNIHCIIIMSYVWMRIVYTNIMNFIWGNAPTTLKPCGHNSEQLW